MKCSLQVVESPRIHHMSFGVKAEVKSDLIDQSSLQVGLHLGSRLVVFAVRGVERVRWRKGRISENYSS